MNRNSTLRGTKILSAAAILAVIFGGLVSQSVRAVGSNPAPVCVGANCTVTFDAIGDYYRWSPPANAQNFGFDLYGAQGGRSGGLGGRVSGTFVTMPTELLIYVGGAGAVGNNAAGGFNGGGQAGAGAGDEGSGGGSTDIRTTVNVADRIVVAAGGGGSGGLNGATGGAGGTAQGSQGNSGQGQGGFGGSTTAPGNGGYPNGGTWGAAGIGAVGGTGGSSYQSGGGGGGGGYFGGGGGGADIDPCCTNGAGGGGGSSWNNTSMTSLSVNTKGNQTGGGKAIISYQIPPEVSYFNADAALTNADSVGFNLAFTQSVTGLDSADFSLDVGSPTCSSTTVTGSTTTYRIVLAGCADGTLKLRLRADSVTGALVGPKQSRLATDLTIDRVAPTLALTGSTGLTNATTLEYRVSTSEPLIGLTASDFSVTGSGCTVQPPINQGEFFTIKVASCATGSNVVLTLAARSATDVAGNLAPPVALVSGSSLTDTLPASLTITSPAGPSNAAALQFRVATSEAVFGLTLEDFEADGQGCTPTAMTTDAADYLVTVAGCSDTATLALAIKPLAVADIAGNQSPASRQRSSIVQIDRVGPVATFRQVQSSTSADAIEFGFSLDEAATGLSAADLSVLGAGCHLDALTGDALDYRVAVSGCSDAERVSVTLAAGSIADSLGNAGPASAISSGSILIDRSAPTPSWVATLIGESFDAVDFDLVFAESVNGLDLADFLIVGSAANCNLTMHEVESSRSFLFHLTGCSVGTVQLASASAAFTDLLGNSGSALLSPVATLAAPVVVAVTPTPTLTPSPSPSVTATPSPSPSQTAVVQPVQPPTPPAPEPETVVVPPVQSPPVQAPPAAQPSPAPTQPPVVVEPEPTPVVVEPAPTAVPAPEISIEPVIPIEPVTQTGPESSTEPQLIVDPLIEAAPIPVLVGSEILVSRPLAIKTNQVAKVGSSEPTSVGSLELVPLSNNEPVQPLEASPIETVPEETGETPIAAMPAIYLATGGIAGTALGIGIAKEIGARRTRPSKRLQRLYA